MPDEEPRSPEPFFAVTELAAAFTPGTRTLDGVTLTVGRGEVVAVVGPNGAGKTTLLRAIAGVVPVLHGTITLEGTRIEALTCRQRVLSGIAYVQEGRRLFPDMTVRENLRLGGYVRPKSLVNDVLVETEQEFPLLKERARQRAGTLSGGEQQMAAIGRALMSRPKLLLMDEPSIGLAPKIVKRVGETIRDVAERGVTVLLVEQNINLAFSVATRAYVLELGRIRGEGRPDELRNDPAVVAAYLA